MNEIIYLDHAAATPVDERVMAAMQPYFAADFYNPSSPYAPAVAVRREYDSAKHRIAVAIGGKPDELIVTAGATESINLALMSAAGHIVTTAIEHPAVLAAARTHEHAIVTPDATGIISAESIAAAIRPDTTLVSVQLANNEIGTIQPLRDIASVVAVERARRLEIGDKTPIFLHSDASQGAGQLDINVARLGVDMITLNAGKMYGPKHMGVLWAKTGVMVLPLIRGGGQERGLRSGTENVPGVMGFATAIELAQAHHKGESERLRNLRDGLQSRLMAAFPDMKVLGSKKRRLAGHLSISFPGLDAERILFMLDMQGVLVATGSACAANKGTRSHVLTAIGCTDAEADGSLRITMGRLSNEQNIQRAGDIIIDCVNAEYERLGR